MGSFDGAKTCELISLHILSKIIDKTDIDLYGDNCFLGL